MNGKKTYIVAGMMVAYAALGFALGYDTPERSIQIILEAAAIAGLRHGMANLPVKSS